MFFPLPVCTSFDEMTCLSYCSNYRTVAYWKDPHNNRIKQENTASITWCCKPEMAPHRWTGSSRTLHTALIRSTARRRAAAQAPLRWRMRTSRSSSGSCSPRGGRRVQAGRNSTPEPRGRPGRAASAAASAPFAPEVVVAVPASVHACVLASWAGCPWSHSPPCGAACRGAPAGRTGPRSSLSRPSRRTRSPWCPRSLRSRHACRTNTQHAQQDTCQKCVVFSSQRKKKELKKEMRCVLLFKES